MKNTWKKNIVVFMASQAISLLGSSLVQYAIIWHITLQTKSGVATMISVICGFLPTLVLSPFAGVWADRYDRKKLIMLADAGIAISTLALALVFMQGYQEIWLLYAVLAIRSFGGAVQMPAVSALLPDMVPKENLTRINAINGSVQSIIGLASPMLSGALMGFAAMETIFFIDVATAAIAIVVMLLFLKIPARVKAVVAGTPNYFKELKSGLGYIAKSKYLKLFFVFMASFNLLVSPVAMLGPLQIARTFGSDVWRLTTMEVVFSVGMVAGGLILAAWGGFKNRMHTLAVGALLMGVCTVMLGFPSQFVLYIVVMGILGLTMPAINTPAMVLLQETVSPDYMGRVFGVMSMISSAIMPLGMMIFGPLADVVPIEWLLRPTGIGMLIGGIALLQNKVLIAAGMPQKKAASRAEDKLAVGKKHSAY